MPDDRWYSEQSARVAHENARKANERDRAERNANAAARLAAEQAYRNRRSTVDPIRGSSTAMPSASASRLAEAIRKEYGPGGIVARQQERARRAVEQRDAAIAAAIAEAAKVRDPRTSAEKLAGMDRHEERK